MSGENNRLWNFKKGWPPTLLFSLKPLPIKRRNLNELSSTLEMLLQFLHYY